MDITMTKNQTKESRQKALKREAYKKKISLSELKRLVKSVDGDERDSPLPHGDIIVSHQSHHTLLSHDAPQEVVPGCTQEAASQEAASREAASPVVIVVPGVHKALSQGTALPEAGLREALWQTVVSGVQEATSRGDASREAPSQEAASPVVIVMPGVHKALSQGTTLPEAALGEALLQEAALREAPPVITVVSGVHEAARGGDASREAASREAKEPAEVAAAREYGEPPLITVVPGAQEAAAQVAAARETETQVAVVHENTENTPPPTKCTRNTPPPPTKCARVSPAQQDAEGVIFVDNNSEVSHDLTASRVGHDVSAAIFLIILLNVNHDTCKFMIIKLVSHSDIRMSIEEVLSTTPIVSQATYNKSAVNWEG